MLKKFVLHLWAARREFAKYFIIGSSSFVLDLGTLFLLKEYLHLRPYVAIIINQILILNIVFFMNKHWSFKSKGMTHKQMMRFGVLALGNYAFATTWMWFFTEFWPVHIINPGKDYLLVRLVNVTLAVGWNFLLYKHWVYANKEVWTSSEPLAK